MGKPQGSEADFDKATWLARFGVEKSAGANRSLYERAIVTLAH